LLDGFEPSSADSSEPVAELDRWVISELNQLIVDVTAEMEDYNPTDAGRKIEAFVGELSTWYVRRSRRRFWKSENDGDKRSAYQTLYTCLVTLSKLMAPLTPFVAEEMYQNLVVASDPSAPDSVHLASFPVADTARIDTGLADATQLVMKVVSMGRAARQKVQAKVRQPLATVLIMPRSSGEGALLMPLADQVRDELNVKTVQVIGADEAAQNLAARLNGSVVGPKYTDKLPTLNKAFATADKEAVIKAVLGGKPITVGEFTLDAEDLDISPSADSPYAGVLEGGYYVAIDTRLTPELKQEGLARELVHNIQNMRRTADFDIADRIVVWHQGDATLQAILASESLGEYIRSETLAVQVQDGTPDADAHVETLKMDGMELTVGIKRAQG
jgi:isoleucyl-tRNA synthetase